MTLVVKIGGGAEVALEKIVGEIAQCVIAGQKVVIVHGGSDLTNTLCRQLGLPIRIITSPGGMVSRYTDRETLRIFAMAVVGQINTTLVALLQSQGVNALGLSGVDGRLLVAKRKAALRSVTPQGRVQIIHDDYTGQIEQVNDGLLRQLLEAGYTPVIAPLALSHDGERLNVDGDRVAAAVAIKLHAETLAILTNVPGLLRNVEDAASLIRSIPFAQLPEYTHLAQGRMRKKLLGAQEALQGGVERVCIGNAALQDVLSGVGTIIDRSNVTSPIPTTTPSSCM
jgi:acetylglutamate/LysW-gamma-L-alpha-aminoadipate kinase